MSVKIDGQKSNILEELRGYQHEFPIGSKEHKIKMEVVKYLGTQGLDYWRYPIPKDVKEAHKDDSEYLKKY